MSSKQVGRVLGALALSAALVAACGSDGESTSDDDSPVATDSGTSGETATTDVSTTAAATGADAPAELPAECPTSVPFDIELRLDGDGERTTMTVVDAVALRRAGGVAMTVYLADFDMPDDTSWALSVPEVPPGSTLVSTGLDVFNTDPATLPPLEVGASGGLFGDVGDGETATFLNIVSEAAGSTSTNQTGTSELLYLDDSTACLVADITGDTGGELVGAYTAPIVADI